MLQTTTGGQAATTTARPDSMTGRATLSQAEFYTVCKRLESDAMIPAGGMTTDQILERHKFAVPGKILSRPSVLKALKTTNLARHVRRPAVTGTGGPMRIAFVRLDRMEAILKQVCTLAGVDASVLDETIRIPSQDANGQQV